MAATRAIQGKGTLDIPIMIPALIAPTTKGIFVGDEQIRIKSVKKK